MVGYAILLGVMAIEMFVGYFVMNEYEVRQQEFYRKIREYESEIYHLKNKIKEYEFYGIKKW